MKKLVVLGLCLFSTTAFAQRTHYLSGDLSTSSSITEIGSSEPLEITSGEIRAIYRFRLNPAFLIVGGVGSMFTKVKLGSTESETTDSNIGVGAEVDLVSMQSGEVTNHEAGAGLLLERTTNDFGSMEFKGSGLSIYGFWRFFPNAGNAFITTTFGYTSGSGDIDAGNSSVDFDLTAGSLAIGFGIAL